MVICVDHDMASLNHNKGQNMVKIWVTQVAEDNYWYSMLPVLKKDPPDYKCLLNGNLQIFLIHILEYFKVCPRRGWE